MTVQAVLRGTLAVGLWTGLAMACARTPPSPSGPQIQWGLVLHGGAGTIDRAQLSPQLEAEYRAALTTALETGYRSLRDGGSSLDAVVSAITTLEDSPLFNAGKGAVFTADGVNSLDAAIMDGATQRAGAIAGVTDVKNPMALARLVMEKSPHVLLSGAGAERFAREQGIPSTPKDWFFTDRRWQELQEAKAAEAKSSAARTGAEEHFGTVGVVALDRSGHLAAGTSTGGMTNKKWGRIGDSPIIGAGTYADAQCGVSGTGWGEFYIRNVVAHDICARTEYSGVSIAQAANDVVNVKLPQQEKNTGGVIVMDRDGHIAMPFNTSGMYRGWIGADGKVATAIFAEADRNPK